MNSNELKALARQIQDKDDEIRILNAKLGNLEFQNSEYSQIVKELSDRIKLYEKISGSVFKARK